MGRVGRRGLQRPGSLPEASQELERTFQWDSTGKTWIFSTSGPDRAVDLGALPLCKLVSCAWTVCSPCDGERDVWGPEGRHSVC